MGKRLGWFGVAFVAFVLFIALLFGFALGALAQDRCEQYRRTLTREAQAIYGLDAPIPALMGQIRQESSCRADVTAWDGGMGLTQFMPGTVEQVSRMYPELGAPNPYNPQWAIRAQVRYDDWLYDRVKGDTECDRWAATFASYNRGLGYVQKAQRLSATPGTWFNATENINAGQSKKSFDDSRRYPHVILFKHQPLYKDWGTALCLEGP